MAGLIKLCSVIFCLAVLIHQCCASAPSPSPSPPSPLLCKNDVTDLVLEQKPTGKKVHNKPQWEVTVTNYCYCSYAGVTVNCDGFKSVEPIDKYVLDQTSCIINYGNSIPGSFSFTYAADSEYPFKLVDASVGCS